MSPPPFPFSLFHILLFSVLKIKRGEGLRPNVPFALPPWIRLCVNCIIFELIPPKFLHTREIRSSTSLSHRHLGSVTTTNLFIAFKNVWPRGVHGPIGNLVGSSEVPTTSQNIPGGGIPRDNPLNPSVPQASPILNPGPGSESWFPYIKSCYGSHKKFFF